MDYSNYNVDLIPFTSDESRTLLVSLLPALAKWYQMLRFQRIVASCGGIPRYKSEQVFTADSKRFLTALADICEAYIEAQGEILHAEFVPKLIEHLLLAIDAHYKVSEWTAKVGGFENLKKLIAVCVGRKSVQLETMIGAGKTVDAILKEGIIFLQPTCPGANFYWIVLPQLTLHLLNMKSFAYPINFLDPLEEVWNWKNFEHFENAFDAFKTTILFDAGWVEIDFLGNSIKFNLTIAAYYNTGGSAALSTMGFKLCRRMPATETQQFLTKDITTPASVQFDIKTKEYGVRGAITFY